jgi:hypothetical protein
VLTKKTETLKCEIEDCPEDAQVGIFETGEIVCPKHAERVRKKRPQWHIYDFFKE